MDIGPTSDEEEEDETIIEERHRSKQSHGDLFDTRSTYATPDLDDRPTKAASIASNDEFFNSSDFTTTANSAMSTGVAATGSASSSSSSNTDGLSHRKGRQISGIEMAEANEMNNGDDNNNIGESPTTPLQGKLERAMSDRKTDLSDWKKAVRRESHHFAILFMVGIFGIALPDFIFDNETALPNKSRIPGEFIQINTTAIIDGNEQSLQYKYFLPDPSFNQKYVADGRVSCNADCLSIWSGPMPFVYTFLTYMVMHHVTKTPYPRYISDAISFTYAYLIGMTLVFWISKYIKYYVAYPRPDFFHRCGELDVDLELETVKCDFDDKGEYRKGWESFPSGHAAYMFTHSTVSILWMFGKLHYIAKKNPIFKQFTLDWEFPTGTRRRFRFIWLVKVVLSWQWFFALWVAITRIRDNRHFPADTVGGIILGGLCGFTGFKSQFGMNYAHSWRLLEETAHSTFDERFGTNAMKSNKKAKVRENRTASSAERTSASSTQLEQKRSTMDIMHTEGVEVISTDDATKGDKKVSVNV